jgi:UDP-N-acetylglucosamine 1-carboxyvinyltransferase
MTTESKTPDTKFRIQRSTLRGVVQVGGAKNSALRLLAASLLTRERVEIENYPDSMLDARVHVEMLTALGKQCDVEAGRVVIREHTAPSSQLDYSGRSIRNTLLILGALVGRTGAGSVPLPGGCKLGDRKYDLHQLLLERLGARVWEENGRLCAETKNGLIGAEIHLPLRSTGATENAILAGCLAKGRTRIWNPHVRPEILDLVAMLRLMGARIEVRGQESIVVDGVEGLSGTKHSVIPDGVEALTWLVGAVITGGDVEMLGFPFDHLEVPMVHLRESGARFYRSGDRLIVRGGKAYPVDIATGPYPGINSDMQPLFAVYGAMAEGVSHIIDLRFPGRYGYARELAKLGMKYSEEGNLLKIEGHSQLRGAEVNALDLRAGVALLLAGMMADGETVIQDAWQIQRGYDRVLEKLILLGANVVDE